MFQSDVLATKSKQSSLAGDVGIVLYVFIFYFELSSMQYLEFQVHTLLSRWAVKLISQAIYQAKPINRLNLIPCA